MGKLIKAEFLKLSKSLGYKVMLRCSLGLGVLLGAIPLIDIEIIEASGYSIYLLILKETQVQALFISIFAAIFICNEFSNRTFSTGIMNGCSRFSLLLSKAVAYVVGVISIIFVYPITAVSITTIHGGFGETSFEIWQYLFITTCLFIVGIIALSSFCFTLAILIKNVGGTTGAGFGLLLLLILVGDFTPFEPIMKFTFTYQLAHASQPESIFLYLAVTCSTIVISLIVSSNIFKRSELK